MSVNLPILSLLIFAPLLGAVFILLFTNEKCEEKAKIIALWTSVITFIISLLVWKNFDATNASMQMVEKFEWVREASIFYHLGVDGVSIYLILLTTLLIPICILASWNSIKEKIKLYMVLFLLLETLVIGVFVSLDFLLFYFFFEASLIPMFIIIGIWGGDNRVYASFKFFLYTLFGSVFLLLAIIYLYTQFGTTDMLALTEKAPELSLKTQKILWIAFFASFAVKVPMFPFHTWLPDAHVQAPTAGSVILAGVLLKLGAYGFLRLSIPMLPDASVYFANLVYILSIIAVIYTSLVALVQEDMKKMIAYSSVAHMSYVTAGIFAFNMQSVQGALFQMLSHGIVSAALFLCVGVLYERMHTKRIDKFGGVVKVMPRFALMFMVFTMASVGLPATSGFVGEFLVLLGIFKDNKIVSALVATGVVLGAAYMLLLYKNVVYGEIKNPEVNHLKDLDRYEKLTLYPLALLAILYGVLPYLITNDIAPSISLLLNSVTK
ncbi:MAG TPA: NADH-quinone oxidoreductase subunit M [Alphaproteobacteria bacterium]|nr:NADH-quinone oxidoreductase subunit M [Alphaproteobacteria bacterium]